MLKMNVENHIRNPSMKSKPAIPSVTSAKPNTAPAAGAPPTGAITEKLRHESLLITGALQNAILNSANFSSIATDEKGVIQLFNVGAERMLGYTTEEVLNKITPAELSDPQELIARAGILSVEFATPIEGEHH